MDKKELEIKLVLAAVTFVLAALLVLNYSLIPDEDTDLKVEVVNTDFESDTTVVENNTSDSDEAEWIKNSYNNSLTDIHEEKVNEAPIKLVIQGNDTLVLNRYTTIDELLAIGYNANGINETISKQVKTFGNTIVFDNNTLYVGYRNSSNSSRSLKDCSIYSVSGESNIWLIFDSTSNKKDSESNSLINMGDSLIDTLQKISTNGYDVYDISSVDIQDEDIKQYIKEGGIAEKYSNTISMKTTSSKDWNISLYNVYETPIDEYETVFGVYNDTNKKLKNILNNEIVIVEIGIKGTTDDGVTSISYSSNSVNKHELAYRYEEIYKK